MRLPKWSLPRGYWPRQQKRRVVITSLAIALIAAGITVAVTPAWRGWVGFWSDESRTTTIEKDDQGNTVKTVETIRDEPGKTLWDWLSLLGVPLSLAVLGYWLQEKAGESAEGRAKEEALQTYISEVSTLLFNQSLLAVGEQTQEAATDAKQDLLDTAAAVIRARTLSVLRRLGNDSQRKASVIRFLAEAEIISRLQLDLSEVALGGTQLEDINLRGANLRKADLSGADLSRADLEGVDLSFANLKKAILSEANLKGADLTAADVIFTDLSNADLSYTNFRSAQMYVVNFGLDLSKARNIPDDAQIYDFSDFCLNLSKAKNIPNELKKRLELE